MAEIAGRCCALKKGSRIVTMDSTFGDGVDFLEKCSVDGQNCVSVEMSFGDGDIYVVRRT